MQLHVKKLTVKRGGYCFLITKIMESNRDKASRYIELSKYYIKRKKLKKAWKFSVKANKLFPTSKTKRESSISVYLLYFLIWYMH